MPSETPATAETRSDDGPPSAADEPSRWKRIGNAVSLAALCALAAIQFLGADPRP
ncbi:hypothetical protein [Halorubrum sp. SS7]|nr:hypothetical protein [Halorubrum sp. SS7]